ncbi:MAG: PHP domain-containing protein [Acidobacteriota bacterium]|nr:PHP domain-containing protein [Acidobacteriota bacterium]
MAAEAEPPHPAGWIDLHAHTDESDGSLTPAELVALARETGLDALAITDHDTLLGYEKARAPAAEAGIDLVCGIELNTRMSLDTALRQRSVHLLAYFLSGQPGSEFATWLEGERIERQSRNERLAQTLRKRGIDITVEEVEQRGRSLAGRPHFARILVEKGYAQHSEEAFVRYLGETAPSFVPRDSQSAEEVISIVRSAGGAPVIAHPIRLNLPRHAERELLLRYRDAGLAGLEVYHSEHPPELQAHYRQLAEELGLLPTGGSDFHGAIKPDIQLGTGRDGNVRVPTTFIEALRAAFPGVGPRPI